MTVDEIQWSPQDLMGFIRQRRSPAITKWDCSGRCGVKQLLSLVKSARLSGGLNLRKRFS